MVFACFSATHKHRLLPCLDPTPQEAWTRDWITAAVGTDPAPRQRPGKEQEQTPEFPCFILTAQLSVSLSSHPAEHTSSNQGSIQVFLAVSDISHLLPLKLYLGLSQVGARRAYREENWNLRCESLNGLSQHEVCGTILGTTSHYSFPYFLNFSTGAAHSTAQANPRPRGSI